MPLKDRHDISEFHPIRWILCPVGLYQLNDLRIDLGFKILDVWPAVLIVDVSDNRLRIAEEIIRRSLGKHLPHYDLIIELQTHRRRFLCCTGPRRIFLAPSNAF